MNKIMGLEIPHQKFVLDNGLTLIVHEDRKAPIVAVNIWYHVGSKNERRGKTGFAHLFEHLMFNGSEHYDDDYFKVLEAIGATDMNGTTDYDRTNYFANVPTPAVDIALWMESDRMGHLLPAITQAKLDEQRGVVQNELRQYENQPYGKIEGIIASHSFPSDHPYSWEVGGAIADLDTVTLEDVRQWFCLYYHPANAVLALAGDISPETALDKVRKYFGHIPTLSPITRHQVWMGRRSGEIRQKTEERAPQAQLYKVWNIPPWGTREGNWLRLVSDVLGSGKNSRLYKRLVYHDQLATEVDVQADLREIAGQFVIQITARPGVILNKVEKALDEELRLLLVEGLQENELNKIRVQYQAGILRRSERIGGFGGKSDLLAAGQVYRNDPDYYRINWEHIQEATSESLVEAASKWLNEDVYILEVHPFPAHTTMAPSADRNQLPASGTPPGVRFPELQRASLKNGLKVVLAEQHNAPLVFLSMLIHSGFAADPSVLPGVAKLTLAVLDEGTRTRAALKIAEDLELLGAELSTFAALDTSVISLSALKDNLAASLDVFADVILNPVFPEKEFLRLRQMQQAEIAQERSRPATMALRMLPGILYGGGHPYGHPLTGTGTEEALKKMDLSDLLLFYRTWFVPNNACLLVVGDTTLKEIIPLLESLLSGWKAAPVAHLPLPGLEGLPKSSIYLLDKPAAPQSLVVAGQLMPPKKNPDEILIETMNTILGGSFTSRLNMNLREDKHWSYGARSLLPDAKGQRPLVFYAPVQTDKTADAMNEVVKEIKGLQGVIPVSEEELKRTKNFQILKLPGSWETHKQIAASLQQMMTFDLPDDYFQTYPQKVGNIQVKDVERIAKEMLHPQHLVWVVVGDREKVEKEIEALHFGDFRIVDVQ